MKTSSAFILFAVTMTLAGSSFASDAPPVRKQQELHPAERYSGNTPIDLSHGLSFNNGTYGLPNQEYEAWAKGPFLAVGISDKPYPYAAKDSFINGVSDRLTFFEAAIHNWQQKSDITKPEALEYAKHATETITPKLDATRDALKKAKSAGNNDWMNAQGEARKALGDLLATYYHLHNNAAQH